VFKKKTHVFLCIGWGVPFRKKRLRNKNRASCKEEGGKKLQESRRMISFRERESEKWAQLDSFSTSSSYHQ